MEYCPYGPLYNYLRESEGGSMCRVPPNRLVEWTKQIASGMKYLHDHKILHRDLKSPKYVVDSFLCLVTLLLSTNTYNSKCSDRGQWSHQNQRFWHKQNLGWWQVFHLHEFCRNCSMDGSRWALIYKFRPKMSIFHNSVFRGNQEWAL